MNKHVLKTYDQLVEDFRSRVSFGFPVSVVVPCKKCGEYHHGFYQYRFGQYITYLEMPDGYLIPESRVIGCVQEYGLDN